MKAIEDKKSDASRMAARPINRIVLSTCVYPVRYRRMSDEWRGGERAERTMSVEWKKRTLRSGVSASTDEK